MANAPTFHKRTATASKVPLTTDFRSDGELLVNTYDGKLFLRKSPGGTQSVVDVIAVAGALGASLAPVQTVNGGTGAVSITLANLSGTQGTSLVYAGPTSGSATPTWRMLGVADVTGALSSATAASTYAPLAGAAFTGSISSVGHTFGSTLAASVTDLTKHISLYSTIYGFSVTSGRLNYVVNSGSSHFFTVAGSDIAYINSSGLNVAGSGTFSGVVTAASGLSITNGTIALLGSNNGLEVGSTSAANTPYMDFHSSGNVLDYDTRILASGGTTSVGGGTLNFYGTLFSFGGQVTASNNFNTTGTNAGYQLADRVTTNTGYSYLYRTGNSTRLWDSAVGDVLSISNAGVVSIAGAFSVSGGINSTSIGATTASSGAFTSLGASGNLTVTGTGNFSGGLFANAGLNTYNANLNVINSSTVAGNNIYLAPAAAGSGVTFGAFGVDTNISLSISPKGSGFTQVNGLLNVTGALTVTNGIFAAGNSAVATQGAFFQWNRAGGDGGTWIVNQKGGGSGGIYFGEATTANVFTQSAYLATNGNLTLVGGLFGTIGSFSSSISGTSIAVSQFFANDAGTGAPTLLYTRSGAPTDQKKWELISAGNDFLIRAVNDAYSATNNAIYITRGTGYTIANVLFPGGTVGIGQPTPSYNLDVTGTFRNTGNATHGGTLTVTGATTLAGLTATTGTFSSGLTGTAIGATSPSTGGFTTLAASGNATVGGTLTVSSGTTLAALNATIGTFSSTVSATGATFTGNVQSNIGGGYGKFIGSDDYHAIVVRADVTGTAAPLTYTLGDVATWIEYGGVWKFRKINGTVNTILFQVDGTAAYYNSNVILHMGNTSTLSPTFTALTTSGNTTVGGALSVTGASTFTGGIQNTPIGSTTANSGSFTTLAANTATSVPSIFTFYGNSNAVYPTSQFGGSIGFNFSAGGGEVNYWNVYTSATVSHRWHQLTGTGAGLTLASLSPAGALTLTAGLTATTGTFSGALSSTTYTSSQGILLSLGSASGQLQLINGSTGYGAIIRNDSGALYFLATAVNVTTGGWNTLRPLTIDLATGNMSIGGTTTTVTSAISGAAASFTTLSTSSTATLYNLSVSNLVIGEPHFTQTGTFSDPDGGVGRDAKFGANGIAVKGGTKTDTLNVTGVGSMAFTRLIGGSANLGGASGTAISSAYSMDNTGNSLLGWNVTGGGGELDVIINRGGGSAGGLNIYDIANTTHTLTNIFALTGAGSLTIPGALTTGGAISVTGNITATGDITARKQTQTYTTSSDYTPMINLTYNDTSSPGSSVFIDAFTFLHNRTGGNGHRQAVTAQITTSGANTGEFNVGICGFAFVNSGSGNHFGGNFYTLAYSGTSSTAEISGCEINTDVRANVLRKTGLQIVDTNTSTGDGSGYSAGIFMCRQAGGFGYQSGIQFGDDVSANMEIGSYALIRTGAAFGGGYTQRGIDFRSTYFTYAAISLRGGAGINSSIAWNDGGGGSLNSQTTTNGPCIQFGSSALAVVDVGQTTTGFQVTMGANPHISFYCQDTGGTNIGFRTAVVGAANSGGAGYRLVIVAN